MKFNVAGTPTAAIFTKPGTAANLAKVAKEAVSLQDSAVTGSVDACALAIALQLTAITMEARVTDTDVAVHGLLDTITGFIARGSHKADIAVGADSKAVALVQAGSTVIAVVSTGWNAASNAFPTWQAFANKSRRVAGTMTTAGQWLTNLKRGHDTIDDMDDAVRAGASLNVTDGTLKAKVKVTETGIIDALTVAAAGLITAQAGLARVAFTPNSLVHKLAVDTVKLTGDTSSVGVALALGCL